MIKKEGYNKLVRDYIPYKMVLEGKKPITRFLGDKNFKKALLDKVREEVDELQQAMSGTRDQMLEEIADIYEALDTLSDLLGISTDNILKEQHYKRCAKGGFGSRIFLESVEVEE